MIFASRTALVALMAAAASPAFADVGRWSSGYNMGMTAATVGNGRATFIVNCVDENPSATSGLMLEVPNLPRQGMDAAVATTISVDNRSSTFRFTRDRAGNISWDAASPGARQDMRALVMRLRTGRSFTVSMPSLRLRETFTTRGARWELQGCPGRR